MAPNTEKTKTVPPYISYSTFKSFLESLGQTLPTRIDRSVMKSLSGTQQSQMRVLLSFLGLTDNYGNITPDFDTLVEAQGDRRKAVLNHLIRRSYTFLFDEEFDISRASMAQLQDKFRQAGAQGETVRKGVTLFVHLADAADIELSHYIASQSTIRSGTATPKARAQRAKPQSRRQKTTRTDTSGIAPTAAIPAPAIAGSMDQWRQQLLAKFPSFDPSWSPEVQSQWFQGFQRLMDMGTPRAAAGGGEDDEESSSFSMAA